MAIKCIKFKSYQKGCLLGFATLYVENIKMEIRGCTLNQKDGKRWVSMPSTPYQKDGETKYQSINYFPEKGDSEQFSEAAKRAIEAFCAEESKKEAEPKVEVKSEFSDLGECPF